MLDLAGIGKLLSLRHEVNKLITVQDDKYNLSKCHPSHLHGCDWYTGKAVLGTHQEKLQKL